MMSKIDALAAIAGASSGIGVTLFLWLLWVWIGARGRARRMARRLDAISVGREATIRPISPNLTFNGAGLDENRWHKIIGRIIGSDGMNYAGQRFSRPQLAIFAGLLAVGALVAAERVFWLGLPIGIVAGLTVWLVFFRILVGVERRHSERLLVASLPDAIDMIVRMVRAGMAVSGAIRTASSDLPQPLGSVFRTIAEEFAIGVPLDQVLGTMALRIRTPEFRFFAVAVSLQHATGGSLTNTLENMAEMMRRRRAMRLKAKAMVSEVRMSAIVLSILPVFVLLVLLVTSRDYIGALFSDRRGNLLLCAAAFCVFAGAASMHWMMRRNLRL